MVVSITFIRREGKTHGEKLYPFEVVFEGNRLFKTEKEMWQFKELLTREGAI